MNADKCGSVLRSSTHPASIDDEYVAVYVVTSARGEKYRGAGDVFGFAPATGWNALEDLAVARFVSLQRCRVGGAHVAGRDCVHVDPVFGPLVCKRLRELCDTAFRSGIRRHGDAALK